MTTNNAMARGSQTPAGSCHRSSGTITPEKKRERHAHQQQERDRILEKQIRQGEAVVLMKDGQRQRQRRVMADELDPPRLFAAMAPEVKGGDGEDCERRDPYAARPDSAGAVSHQERGPSGAVNPPVSSHSAAREGPRVHRAPRPGASPPPRGSRHTRWRSRLGSSRRPAGGFAPLEQSSARRRPEDPPSAPNASATITGAGGAAPRMRVPNESSARRSTRRRRRP